MDTAAEAEKRSPLLPHRGEMPQCWGRQSEVAEDSALSSWPGRCQEPRSQLLISLHRKSPGIASEWVITWGLKELWLRNFYYSPIGRARERGVGADRAQLTAELSRIPPFYMNSNSN